MRHGLGADDPAVLARVALRVAGAIGLRVAQTQERPHDEVPAKRPLPGTVEPSDFEYMYIEVFEYDDVQKLLDYYVSGNPRTPRRWAFDIIVDGALAAILEVG